VRLHQRGLVLAWADGTSEWRVPFSELSGVALKGGALVLYGATGSVTITSNYALAGLWRELLDRACAVPELARGARTVGSRRGGDPATQARFFAPLLDARRRAELQETIEGKAKAFDGREIAASIDGILQAMARARWPQDLPEQRALGAELEECCEPLFSACETLARAADDWFETPDEERLEAWRVWIAAAARLFEAADRSWGQMTIALGSATPTR
jgi:hypothetical protein